nr:hypothetical protein [Pandoravirus massiliensis]
MTFFYPIREFGDCNSARFFPVILSNGMAMDACGAPVGKHAHHWQWRGKGREFVKTAVSALLVTVMLRPQKRARTTDETIVHGDGRLWTDDVRAHVVWGLVVATLAQEGVLLSNTHTSHVAASGVIRALCALAQTCPLTRSAICDAAIFVDALYGADLPPDDLWSGDGITSIERCQTLADNATLALNCCKCRLSPDYNAQCMSPSYCRRRCRTPACPRHYRPLDYSKRGKLLGVRTRLHRSCGGYDHVTFEHMAHYYTVYYALFRGYLCSSLTPAYYRCWVCEEVRFIDLSENRPTNTLPRTGRSASVPTTPRTGRLISTSIMSACGAMQLALARTATARTTTTMWANLYRLPLFERRACAQKEKRVMFIHKPTMHRTDVGLFSLTKNVPFCLIRGHTVKRIERHVAHHATVDPQPTANTGASLWAAPIVSLTRAACSLSRRLAASVKEPMAEICYCFGFGLVDDQIEQETRRKKRAPKNLAFFLLRVDPTGRKCNASATTILSRRYINAGVARVCGQTTRGRMSYGPLLLHHCLKRSKRWPRARAKAWRLRRHRLMPCARWCECVLRLALPF